VPIYQGDIDSEGYTFTYCRGSGTWQRWWGNVYGINWHALALIQGGKFPHRIVGNIRENPELSKKKSSGRGKNV